MVLPLVVEGGIAGEHRAERVEGSRGEGRVLPPGGGGGYSRRGEGRRGGPSPHRERSHALWPREAAREPLDGCSLNDLTCRKHAHRCEMWNWTDMRRPWTQGKHMGFGRLWDLSVDQIE